MKQYELEDLIYTKWLAVVDRIWEEYKQTEEYAARQENRRIIREHNERVNEFMEKYGVGTAVYCRNKCWTMLEFRGNRAYENFRFQGDTT